MFLTFIVGLSAFVLTWLYIYLRRNRGYVETLGLPVDQPNIVFGSSPLLPHQYLMHNVQMDKMRRFGKTYVGYDYVQPILVTIDPELIKAVTITHFENFSDILNFKIESKVTTLDVAGGTVWHVLRKNMSPTFSSGKLKGMMEPISDIADDMIQYLNDEIPKNPDVNVKELFQGEEVTYVMNDTDGLNKKYSAKKFLEQVLPILAILRVWEGLNLGGDEQLCTGLATLMITRRKSRGTIFKDGQFTDMCAFKIRFALETISQSAFGIRSNAFRNKTSDLLKHGQEAFSGFVMHNLIESLVSLALFQFPALFSYISIFPSAYYKLYDVTANIMKQRSDQGIKKKDFLARLQELVEEIKQNPNGEVGKNLTEEHVNAQGAVFFLAGFETTANTLSTLCYNLAKHPEIQDKVREEITNVVDECDGRIDYDSVQGMKYLEACIHENLRMYPPATLHLRQCTKDSEIAPGLVIKKGMRVDFPIYTSHHNPEFFPEPETFDPERFMPENEKNIKTLTYRPFGGGPRFCIGQRFALIEMKMAVAKLLTNYQISTSPQTQLEFETGSPFLLSYPELILRIEKL